MYMFKSSIIVHCSVLYMCIIQCNYLCMCICLEVERAAQEGQLDKLKEVCTGVCVCIYTHIESSGHVGTANVIGKAPFTGRF